MSEVEWDPQSRQEVVATSFIRLQMWGGMAEQLMELDPGKGTKLWVNGKLDQSEWEDSEGKKEKRTRVNVTWFIPTDPKFRPESSEPPPD